MFALGSPTSKWNDVSVTDPIQIRMMDEWERRGLGSDECPARVGYGARPRRQMLGKPIPNSRHAKSFAAKALRSRPDPCGLDLLVGTLVAPTTSAKWGFFETCATPLSSGVSGAGDQI